MTDHDFDDEHVHRKAYQISEKNKEQSPEDNWVAAIKALERQERISRDGIKDENGLISNRLTWMTTINGLLFSALGFSIGKYLSIWFFLTIGGMGCLISLSTGLALNRAMRATEVYIDKFSSGNFSGDLKTQKNDAEGKIIGYIEECKLVRFLLPQNFLPLIFGIAWLVIIGFVLSGNLDQTIGKTLQSSITPSPIPSNPTPSKAPSQIKSKNQSPAAQKNPLKTKNPPSPSP